MTAESTGLFLGLIGTTIPIAVTAVVSGLDPATVESVPWGTISASGILTWYLWYSTAKLIPNLMQSHAEERAKVQAHYENVLREIGERHREDTAKLTIAIDHLSHQIDCISSSNDSSRRAGEFHESSRREGERQEASRRDAQRREGQTY